MKRKESKQTIAYLFDQFEIYQINKGNSECAYKRTIQCVEAVMKVNNYSLDDEISVFTKESVSTLPLKFKELGKSPNGTAFIISRLRVFLYWCMEEGYLDSFKIKLPKGTEPPLKVYSDEDLAKLTAPLNTDSFTEHRTRTMVCFVLATGARLSTLTNIRLDDIDLKSKRVFFSHLKNNQTAVIPLSNALVDVLKRYLDSWELDGFLFPQCDGRQMTKQCVSGSLKKYCDERGVKSLGIHALRHSFARGWVKNGGGVFQLQQMLTHSDLTMTRRYVKLFSDDLVGDVNTYCPLKIERGSNAVKNIRRK